MGLKAVSSAGGGSSVTYADNEVPTGAINGVNDTFTLANTPNPSGSLELYLNGLLQRSGGTDFTLTGASIVFAAAAKPQTGDDLRAWYRY